MGMYTGLRGIIRVPTEYMEAFSNVFISRMTWDEVNIPLTENYIIFLQDGRRNFIPLGVISSMPDDWESVAYLKDDMFVFGCSLKNHNSTISKFIKFLDEIKAEYKLEELYEEFVNSTIHERGNALEYPFEICVEQEYNSNYGYSNGYIG